MKAVFGPGILFAATAIGVSHLVQSTTAGGKYGLSLLGFLILALVLKFPFFEFGSRYAVSTGESLISGYKKLNKIWLYIYLLLTLSTMFFVTGAVGIVTIGFMENIFKINAYTQLSHLTHYLLFGVCVSILLWGKFDVMEKTIKVLGVTMLVTTVVAFIATLHIGPATAPKNLFPEFTHETWLFLLPLMGWMPTAIDLSTWNSMWTIEKIKSSGYHPKLKETLTEFNIGYWISALLAILFLIMGAFLVFGTNKEVPSSGVAFSGFVLDLYTYSLGSWALWIVSIAAFAIMFSTLLTIIDGYNRALKETFFLLSKRKTSTKNSKGLERLFILITGIGGLIIIIRFEGNPDGFKLLVDLATTISFVVAPVIAVLNFRLVLPDKIGKQNTPGVALKIVSILGILYLIAFTIWFLFL